MEYGRRMCDSINVELNEEEIEKMSPDEKLTCLLKIAFSNHSKLMEHDQIFYGNGKKGIIPTIQGQGYYITGLCTALMIILGILIKMLVK